MKLHTKNTLCLQTYSYEEMIFMKLINTKFIFSESVELT